MLSYVHVRHHAQSHFDVILTWYSMTRRSATVVFTCVSMRKEVGAGVIVVRRVEPVDSNAWYLRKRPSERAHLQNRWAHSRKAEEKVLSFDPHKPINRIKQTIIDSNESRSQGPRANHEWRKSINTIVEQTRNRTFIFRTAGDHKVGSTWQDGERSCSANCSTLSIPAHKCKNRRWKFLASGYYCCFFFPSDDGHWRGRPSKSYWLLTGWPSSSESLSSLEDPS